MQRIWLVTTLSLISSIGCSPQGPSRADIGQIEVGCVAPKSDEERRIARIAEERFEGEVGVRVTGIRIGKISKCTNSWIVPVLASTEQMPTERLWYLELTVDGKMIALDRPM